MKDKLGKWILFDGDDHVFKYATAEAAKKDQRIFNKEKMDWENDYQLYKHIARTK